MKSGKVWGNTELIYRNDALEVHRIEAHKGGYCSKHLHKTKFNMFYVESGSIAIECWKSGYDLIDTTLLSAGDKTSVPPGEYHRFKVLEDTVAYEIYYVELESNDIIRETIGGNK